MAMGALRVADKVNGCCDLLYEENDKLIVVLEQIEEEVEIVLNTIVCTSKCRGLR